MRYQPPSLRTLALTAALATAAAVIAALAQPVVVRVDGLRVPSDVPAITTPHSGTYVPVRAFANALGATMYQQRSGWVTISRGENSLRLRAGSREALADGHARLLKHAPFMVRGRLMVDLTTLANVFEVQVHVNVARGRIEIQTLGVAQPHR